MLRNFVPDRLGGEIESEERIGDTFVLSQNSKQKVFGLDLGGGEQRRLIPGEKYRPPRLFRVPLKHRPDILAGIAAGRK